MSVLAKLIVLAAMMQPTPKITAQYSYDQIGAMRDFSYGGYIALYTVGDTDKGEYCYLESNLYLYQESGTAILYTIIPNDNVLRSCVAYTGNNSAIYTVYYLAPMRDYAMDTYTIGIDTAYWANGKYTGDYQTTYRVMPVDY